MCFFSNQNDGNNENLFWENTTPSTELPRDLCAGIGPLQLGVVLVSSSFYFFKDIN